MNGETGGTGQQEQFPENLSVLGKEYITRRSQYSKGDEEQSDIDSILVKSEDAS